jgi:hypothetical protein
VVTYPVGPQRVMVAGSGRFYAIIAVERASNMWSVLCVILLSDNVYTYCYSAIYVFDVCIALHCIALACMYVWCAFPKSEEVSIASPTNHWY